MRLWSLHPCYLDPQGLVALWREGLLAQKVLRGKTRGYRHHPQLERFRFRKDPVAAIGAYLSEVYREATRRGYHFDVKRVHRFSPRVRASIPVTRGQLAYEQAHLAAKLWKRSPAILKGWGKVARLRAHPLFVARRGAVEAWEKVGKGGRP